MGSQFGFELMNIHNDGGDFYLGPFQRTIDLHALQVDISLACSGGNGPTPNKGESGFAQALCYGFWTPSKPTFAATTIASLNSQPDPTLGSYSIYDPNNIAAAGNAPVSNCLFAVILKTWFPSATSRGLVVPYSSLSIPAGSYFVIHADHTGYQADLEFQGVLHYA